MRSNTLEAWAEKGGIYSLNYHPRAELRRVWALGHVDGAHTGSLMGFDRVKMKYLRDHHTDDLLQRHL